jgi:hypothetical protein
MRDCSLFQANISVLVMHVVCDSQPLFLLLCSRILSLEIFFRQKCNFLGEKTHVAIFFLDFFFSRASSRETPIFFFSLSLSSWSKKHERRTDGLTDGRTDEDGSRKNDDNNTEKKIFFF